MKKITAITLNDSDGTSYRTEDSSDRFTMDILVKHIYIKELVYPDGESFVPPQVVVVVELLENRDDIEFPYHSVLLIRREK